MPPKRTATAPAGAMKRAAGKGMKRTTTSAASSKLRAAAKRSTKSGSKFRDHDGHGGDDSAEQAVKQFQRLTTKDGRKKLVLGNKPTADLNLTMDTERTLPSFMQGRVKGGAGQVDKKLQQVGGGKSGKGGRRALPKKVGKDSKGKRYATGKGGQVDAEETKTKRRGSDDFSAALDRMDREDEIFRKSKRNPVVKYFQGQVRAFKRYMLLRKQAKIPVTLGERAKAVTDALEMEQKHLKQMRAAYHEVDFDRMGNISYEEFFEWLDEPRSLFTVSRLHVCTERDVCSAACCMSVVTPTCVCCRMLCMIK